MKEKDAEQRAGLRLTEICWPVFEYLVNFTRQVKYGGVPSPEEARYEALSALRDAEDLARRDPTTERAWEDRVKAMMVYLLDYKMLNTEWAGRDYWFENRFETSTDGLNHVEALGGEKFFTDCDEIQKEYEVAERRDRRDKDELAEQLSLYFICLRLGFKGQFHDRPQELADYTRRLFTRLPAYGATRGKEMFPEAYRHNQEVKVDYKLGMSVAVVLATFGIILITSLVTFRLAWRSAVSDINAAAVKWDAHQPAAAPAPAPRAAEPADTDSAPSKEKPPAGKAAADEPAADKKPDTP